MNVNQLIINTLSPLDIPIEPDVYTGDSDKWITFNYADDRGGLFADDGPTCDIVSMQIHLFTPLDFDYLNLKETIRSLLYIAGFSYAKISTIYEDDTKLRHTIFECEKESEE